MPVYHSTFADAKGEMLCGTIILPIKTKVKGPAPPARADQKDMVDEAIEFFRANVLFRNFDTKSPADLTLCYLTVYISQLLRKLKPYENKKTAASNVTQVSMDGNFAIPGDASFCFPGFFKTPQNRAEADKFRQYFRQLREETATRLLDVIFNADETQNKWWFSFHKRKFMNITST